MNSAPQFPRTHFIIFWVFISICLPCKIAPAQGLLFPASEWGKARMALPQSASRLESLFQVADENFEPIVGFSTESPYRKIAPPVGRLEIMARDRYGQTGIEICTASLLPDGLALTNDHCIPGPGNLTLVKAQIRMGYLSDRSFPGDIYPVSIVPVESDRNLDYAIVKVSNNPQARYGSIALGPKTVSPGEDLFIIHHPLGKPMQLTRKDCRVVPWKEGDNNHIDHRCDTLDGSSGAPIFSLITWKVVGLHFQGGLGPTDESFNSGVRLDKIISNSATLQAMIRQKKQRTDLSDRQLGACDMQDPDLRASCVAARKGDPQAQYRLGVAFSEGNGVQKNHEESARWFKRAALQGHNQAQMMLGYLYEKGYGVPMDWEKSVYWTTKAAKAGEVTAQFNLAEAYEIGTGVGINIFLADYWYRQAAEKGVKEAQLRRDYLFGTAQQFYDFGYSCYNKGEAYYNLAVYWYTKAAQKGHINSMVELGNLYYNGHGLRKDYAEAVRWYREAADENNMYAQYNLGVCYKYGNGVRQDLRKAKLWYQKSASQGFEKAKTALAGLGQ